jgi:hypothetical protein
VKIDIDINRRRLTVVLLAAAVLLLIPHLAVNYLRQLGYDNVMGLLHRFNFDSEGNIPTWYSTALLLACAAVMFVIGSDRRAPRGRFSRHWKGLALIFALMSLDEAAAMHEWAGERISALMERLAGGAPGGVLHFVWLVPGLLFVVLVGAYYYRFVLHLNRPVRRGFVAAAAIYLCGAVGMEMVGGKYLEAHTNDFVYYVLAGVEELLEMVGLIVLLNALLLHAESRPAEELPAAA